MELRGCNRHVDDTAVYVEMVAALFLRHVCDCYEVSNLDVVDDVVADIDDVPAAAEADDVDAFSFQFPCLSGHGEGGRFGHVDNAI